MMEPVLAHGCETWNLTGALERIIPLQNNWTNLKSEYLCLEEKEELRMNEKLK